MFTTTNFRVYSFLLSNALAFCLYLSRVVQTKWTFISILCFFTEQRETCLLLFLPKNFRILCGVTYSFDYMLKDVFKGCLFCSQKKCT